VAAKPENPRLYLEFFRAIERVIDYVDFADVENIYSFSDHVCPDDDFYELPLKIIALIENAAQVLQVHSLGLPVKR
jgi:hypothetical protein